MNIIIFPVQTLIISNSAMKGSFGVGIVIEEGMPVFIRPVLPGSYFFPIKSKSFLSFGFGHGLMNKRLVIRLYIILWWSLSILDLFEILMPWIWIKMMWMLWSWFKIKSFIVIKIWLCYILNCHHKFLFCWFFNW